MMNGIDISSHQTGIDLSKVPCDFVIIKATGGTGYVNPDCDRAFQQALSLGKKIGVYHFAHEKGLEGTPEQEAQFFLNNIKGYIGKAILILDFEGSNQKDVNWAKAFLDYVYNKTGVKAWFYTYTANLNTTDFSNVAKGDYGLWIAEYGRNLPQGYSQPSPPRTNNFPVVACFQYTSSGRLSGYNGNIDLNVFYGDQKTWDLYVGKKSDQIVPPENKIFDATSDEFIFTLTKGSTSVFYFDGNTIFELSDPTQLDHIRGTYNHVHGKEIPSMVWTPEQFDIYLKMYDKKPVYK